MYDARDGSALWDFALAAYAKPGVAPLCLELQDHHGANVMLMLHLCHCAARGQATVDVAAAAHAMAPLEHHLIAPLRRARRAISAAAETLGDATLRASAKRLLRAELAAERLQCLRVDDPVAPPSDRHTARDTAAQLLHVCFLSLPGEGWQRQAADALAEAVLSA
jgi:uncharacterized protein (TIGR02444 family)